MIESTSASLLERLKQPGQKEAWDRFVELYTPFLHEQARRLGAQPQDAADLVQEVFVKVLVEIPKFTYDKSKTFRGLLKSIMHNKWVDVLRRRKTPVGAAQDFGLGEVADSDDCETRWEAEHNRYLLRRGLELICNEFEPATYQTAWETIVAGRAAADVARQFGVTENAVYIAKHRVLRRLKQELDGLMD